MMLNDTVLTWTGAGDGFAEKAVILQPRLGAEPDCRRGSVNPPEAAN
jgi:hypothetical protein